MTRKSRAKPDSPFRYLKSTPKVIREVVMLYIRFPLSLRNVDAQRCWPLHRTILAAVRPKAIVAFGSGEKKSSFAYLRTFLAPQEIQSIPAEQPGFTCYAFKSRLEGVITPIVVVPHLTRYPPYKKPAVMDWLRAYIA